MNPGLDVCLRNIRRALKHGLARRLKFWSGAALEIAEQMPDDWYTLGPRGRVDRTSLAYLNGQIRYILLCQN